VTTIGRTLLGMATIAAAATAGACSNPEKEQLKKTTLPTYDEATGKLTELTYDFNKNGKIDTWTQMDGARPVLTRMDANEDGKIDRWEYYGPDGKLLKVGFSRRDDGKPDAWAFQGPDGQVQRVEVSSTGDDKKIDRWEHHAGGAMVAAEADTDGDRKPDKWETYKDGAIESASFDENKDGRPDRRMTYRGGALVLIESAPDASGTFTKKVDVKK
jgi:hypothetical protein